MKDAVQVRVSRWGKSLGLRIPEAIAVRLVLRQGSRVNLTTDGARIIVEVDRPVFDLDDLLVGMTPAALRDAFDWGTDRGCEVMD